MGRKNLEKEVLDILLNDIQILQEYTKEEIIENVKNTDTEILKAFLNE